ncbi:MAG: hypothetical protein WCW36_01895 [Candidatus Paceibacterota bacterium]
MKIGRLEISWNRRPWPRLGATELADIDERYAKALASGKKLILGTLCARSGTMWLCDIFDEHKNATGITERNFEAEAYYRFTTYNKLPVDTTGIIALIKHGILEDWKRGDIALVFSPYFSHGMLELYRELSPEKIIFAVSDPEFTVQSVYNKGFFSQYYLRGRDDLALGFQPAFSGSWSQYFGRIVPNGPAYRDWEKLTRIGKISWWGNRINVDIAQQLSSLPSEKIHIFNLQEADQNYEWYLRIAKEFGLAPIITSDQFLSIKGRRVRAEHNVHHEWSPAEREEFELQTKEWKDLYEKLCIGDAKNV